MVIIDCFLLIFTIFLLFSSLNEALLIVCICMILKIKTDMVIVFYKVAALVLKVFSKPFI